MPLDTRCSLDAFRENVRELMRKYDRDQALAIAYETLRRACLSPEEAERAKREQWTPKEIVGEDVDIKVEDLPKWVIAMALDSLSEEDRQLLAEGLKKRKSKIEEEVKSAEAAEIAPRGIEDAEIETEQETLTQKEVEEKLLKYLVEAITAALAEYFSDLDFDRLTTRDISNITKALSNVLYKLSRRYPILGRKELTRLKARGPEGFIRFFRAQLI